MHTSWVIYFSNNFYGSEKEKNATAIGRFDYSFMVKLFQLWKASSNRMETQNKQLSSSPL